MSAVLVSVRHLCKSFSVPGDWFTRHPGLSALEDVSLDIYKGETLALVGESGCGKSTLGKCILRLIEPSAGSIHFNQIDLRTLSVRDLRRIRKKMQMIFQDPYAALDPRMTVEEIMTEPLQIHQLARSTQERKDRVVQLLQLCGLSSSFLSRYPRELSGGQRQRLCIARALAVEPAFIVCDEPLSSLDISIQMQILNLLKDLQKQLGLTYLFISHDLQVVSHLATRVAVMYQGKIVETSTAEEFQTHPQHPYTQALRAAIPIFKSS